ncbi:MAG: DUF1854 domain-containing protein [Acidobacteria bacterium]|nr:DUF1854 domain-containing protein [Acidobacteriota bacterium]
MPAFDPHNGSAFQPLIETPPPFLEARLEQDSAGDVLLCVRSDIDLHGSDNEQWLAVTSDALYTGTAAQPDGIVRLPLAAASEFRALGGVGSGLLQAKVDGAYIDLVRYSNSRAYRFERAARKLDRFLQGEPIEVLPEDEVDPRRCTTCGLLLELGGACPRCIDRGRVLARIAALLRPYRGAATAIMLLLVAGIALDLVSPQLTRYLVDTVLPGSADEAQALQADPMQMQRNLGMLLQVVLVLAVVQVLRQVVNGATGYLSSRVGTSLTFDMRGRLVAHLQQLAVGFYDRQQVGTLVGRVAYDSENLHQFVIQVTGGFLLQLLMIVGVGIMMFSIDVTLALCTLIPSPLVVAGTIFFWKYVYPRYYRVWDASGKQAGMLTGLLSGIRVVKAFDQERRQERRFNVLSDRVRRTHRDVDTAIGGLFNPVMGIVFQLGGWIVWFVGGRKVLAQHMTLGELMAFFGYLWMFYGPLGMLPQFTNWLTQFLTQSSRLFEILDTPHQIAEPAQPVHVAPIRGAIRFERVSFGYTRHAPVLKNLDFEVRPGELIGLVGQSGSGKSTIINLICRFYDVDEGRVLIDGVDVRDIPKSELRSQVGVALQDAFLFRGSIWDNLTFGKPGAEAEEVIAAAKAADCHDFVLRHPHGYDTWVGESGAGLSGGERQRIGIARVLLTDPRILILDESTSSVDAQTEASIQRALAELMRNRTTLAIAHRLSTLRGADRILVLEDGKIAESGSPDELLESGGRFAQMVRIRQGESGSAARVRFRDGAPEEDSGPAEHHLRWLDPSRTAMRLDGLGTLHVRTREGGEHHGVYALRCFPVRRQREYISLRSGSAASSDREIGLIRSLDEWPREIQSLIQDSLRRRYYVQTIRSLQSVQLANNHLNFRVETDLGPQRFTLRWQTERVQDYGARGKMLLDSDENRFLIPDLDALTPHEQRVFRRYVYW